MDISKLDSSKPDSLSYLSTISYKYMAELFLKDPSISWWSLSFNLNLIKSLSTGYKWDASKVDESIVQRWTRPANKSVEHAGENPLYTTLGDVEHRSPVLSLM